MLPTGSCVAEQGTPPLDLFIADELKRRSGDVAGRWLEHIEQRRRTGPPSGLPLADIERHLRQLVGRIAESVGPPGATTTEEVIGHLRAHARLRRRQGYDIHELLEEFEVLADLLGDAIAAAVERYPGPADPRDAVRIAGRVHAGLMAVGVIAAQLYRREEIEQRQELARLMGEFGRTLSHELKNPLAAAEGAAHMLEEEEFGGRPEQRERFTVLILRNLERARTLIDDVRVLARGTERIADERIVPLSSVVAEVVAEVREEAEAKKVRLEIDEPLLEVQVAGSRIALALLNLVRNSIKYSDPAKPERWVRVGTRREENGAWSLYVADNGLGIPRELQGRIFEQFFRAHPGVAEGTGLGLVIARQAVEQLGGRMSFESEPGVGTTFSITLPGGAESA